MGRAWARNLGANTGAELVGWIDVRPGAARAACEELGLDSVYSGEVLDAAVQECQPDFVVDVTPPEAHHDVVVRVLEMGLPVLGEKPMASTMEEARRMVAASERAGKLYMVSQSRRYDDGLVAFRKVIRERLGELGMLSVDFYIGAHFDGFRAEMPSPLLLDMAIHTFDEARFLSGAEPVAVYAEEFNPPWSWYKGAACASVLFEMSDGVRFNYRGSWCSDGLHTSWDGDWRAVGPKGSATWMGNGDPVFQLYREEPMVESKRQVERGIAGSLAEFLEALDSGSTPQGECHDNIKSLAMVFAAVESSRRGERFAIVF
jgi:predicted dehydrogenase